MSREAEDSRAKARADWAVFGGSFDPPHVGHVLVAAYVLAARGVERVLVTPTAAHAFGKKLTSFEDRSKMCELAFAPLRGVELCMIERELPAPNYTLHTLQALAKRYPDVQLRLLAGSDLQAETHAWHDFEAIEKLAPPLWIARQGSAPIAGEPMMPDVSSTEVRRRIAAGESTSSLLSPAVAEYIRAHALYQ